MCRVTSMVTGAETAELDMSELLGQRAACYAVLTLASRVPALRRSISLVRDTALVDDNEFLAPQHTPYW
ncbi:hypothetical protein D3C72_2130410 [compost metagenome]